MPLLKWWWSKDLAEQKKATHQLGASLKGQRQNPGHVHEAYCVMRNQYTEAMRKAKVDYWVEWLEGLDVSNVWTVGKIVSSPAMDTSNSRIPTLCTKDPITKRITRSANTNDSKSKMFYETFFPPTNPHLPPLETNLQYPLPRWTFANISNDQIQLAIARLKPYKARKHGSIPNSILTQIEKYWCPIWAPFSGPLTLWSTTQKIGPLLTPWY